MMVFYQDTETGETLEVVAAGKAPRFTESAASWATQLRLLYLGKHVPEVPSWDAPTAAVTAPPVLYGYHEIVCGDQRFFER